MKHNRILCAIGLHSVGRMEKWTPGISAKVVTEFEQTLYCKRCEKVLMRTHWRWDGKDMVDVLPMS